MPGVDLRNYSFQHGYRLYPIHPVICVCIYIYVIDRLDRKQRQEHRPGKVCCQLSLNESIHKNTISKTQFFLVLGWLTYDLHLFTAYLLGIIMDYHNQRRIQPFTNHSPTIHQPFTNHSPTIHQPFTNHSWPLDSRRSLMATLILDSDEEDVVIIAERFLKPPEAERLRTNGRWSGGWHGSGRAMTWWVRCGYHDVPRLVVRVITLINNGCRLATITNTTTSPEVLWSLLHGNLVMLVIDNYRRNGHLGPRNFQCF